MTRIEHPQAANVVLSETDTHALLSSGSRRTTLRVLADCETPVELDELAAAVATAADGVLAAGVEEIDRTAIRLHHVDLPKLADAGLVDYDSEDTRVTGVHDDAARLAE